MKFSLTALSLAAVVYSSAAFRSIPTASPIFVSRSRNALRMHSTLTSGGIVQKMAEDSDKKDDKKVEDKKPKVKPEDLTGFERFQWEMEDAKKNKRGPPIYEPGPYTNQILASLAYLIPIADAADLSKYMFEAYPDIGSAYNTLFGPIAAIYNGVPFLPFAIFFVMSYVCRAPNFPTEVRFHFAQAFMISLVQFVPSLTFGFLEKAGVPGMGVLYNTGTKMFT